MSTVADEPTKRNGRREQQVRAKPCPRCGSVDTYVGSTLTIVRYCYCRRCRNSWRQTPKVN